MARWIELLSTALRHDRMAVLITVAHTRGSVPRETGARMIVSPERCLGSIGGGQLEHRAQQIAASMLQQGAQAGEHRTRIVRFPLGASVGQCCGGVVQLGFEAMNSDDLAWVDSACALDREGVRWGRLRRFSSAVNTLAEAPVEAPPVIFTEHDLESRAPSELCEAVRVLLKADAGAASLVPDPAFPDAPWLIDVTPPTSLTVVVFGAGHVGCAIAEVLGKLPMHVIWVDGRASQFPRTVAGNIDIRVSDSPIDEVEHAPDNAFFLVMTHSHALDFDLIRAILDRGEFGYLGLIGSTSKKMSFAARLRARGYPDGDIARIHCPIGVPGVNGKEPEVIAISVAASLMQCRDMQHAEPAAIASCSTKGLA